MCMYISIYVYNTYIYIYRERERDVYTYSALAGPQEPGRGAAARPHQHRYGAEMGRASRITLYCILLFVTCFIVLSYRYIISHYCIISFIHDYIIILVLIIYYIILYYCPSCIILLYH